MKRIAFPMAALCAAAVLASCAGQSPQSGAPAAPAQALVAAPVPTPAPAAERDLVYRETGTAVWYGAEFHGRRTASGETFDMNGSSAAHRTLPLGTVIRVTNLDNSTSIRVTVTDRGPFVRTKALKLSLGAAKELGFVPQGTARVSIESVDPVRTDGVFSVQAAAFVEEEMARTLKERLQRKYETVFIVTCESNIGTFYRVRVGAYPSEEKAGRIAAKLTLDGLEPVVVRKD
ncbi:MAG: septal ring lytic transglycosylase RlpA family protein [Nitrospirota bacterium]